MRLLTSPGTAGVAVARFDADERHRLLACLQDMAARPFAVTAGAPPRRASLHLDGASVDDVLVVDRGDRGLELHLHGSRAVLAALARHFAAVPTPTPPPAEQLLRNAMCEAQLDLAIEQLGFDFEAHCRELAAAPPAAAAATRERSRIAMAMVAPARLVLVGAQNAGKSSLFNRLLFRERALVGPLPGLTRDPIAEVTVLDGYPYELVDTAGEGLAASAVDAVAIARGRELRGAAFVVLVIDAAVGPGADDRELADAATLVVANKADLVAAPWPAELRQDVAVSCRTEDALLLRARLGAILRRQRALPPAGPVGGPAALTSADLARLDALQRG